MIWYKEYTVEEMQNPKFRAGLVELLDITITEVGSDYVKARMPVLPRVHQVHGIMHGGATCVLVETVGSFASLMCLDTEQQYSVGSYINVNHLRPISSGVVVANCKAVHIGRMKHVWDIPVYNEADGKLIAKGELTCAILTA